MKTKIFLSIFASTLVFLSCGTLAAKNNQSKNNHSSSAPSSTSENQNSESSFLEITFDYNRASTIASNQMALWVENANGELVKTLYVSDFTAKGRGYRRRADSLNHWVSAANPESLSGREIDVVSGATLRTGSQNFFWDLTDSNGNKVQAGKYFVKLEGTLYWKSNVLYSAQVDFADGTLQIGEIQETRSEKSNQQNENMISNVKITGHFKPDSESAVNSSKSSKIDNTKNWLGGLSPEDALSYMEENYDKGLVIVEVNTDYWKLKNGFTGALHIPHDQMAKRYAELPSGVPVILHCGAGVVSVPAYETLKEKRPDIPVLSYIDGRPPVAEFNAWVSSHKK